MRTISTSKGCRSLKSVDCGLRPNASETSLPEPTNFPLGEDHVSSASSFVFILTIMPLVGSVVAPGHDEPFARNPCGIWGSQKDGRRGDVLRLANAAQRRL